MGIIGPQQSQRQWKNPKTFLEPSLQGGPDISL
jgi:hypothetical protein